MYNVNITFIYTGKKNNPVISVHGNIHFIAVVLNQTCQISEVCLYILSSFREGFFQKDKENNIFRIDLNM